MQDLKITLIQSELIWEDIDSNLDRFDQQIDQINENTHLIILPEMFTTGFTMNAPKLAQDMNESAVKWIKNKSLAMGSDILGSMIIRENDKFFNRLIWARSTGHLHTYDKKHLFRLLGEEKVFSPGEKKLIIEMNGWRLRPFICYDLRFPVWARNFKNQYDVAIFIANWPDKRAQHWKTLLMARAIENQSYVIGVNRIGTDGNDLYYRGSSSVIDPSGEYLFTKDHDPVIHTTSLSYAQLQEYREKCPFWKDADKSPA